MIRITLELICDACGRAYPPVSSAYAPLQDIEIDVDALADAARAGGWRASRGRAPGDLCRRRAAEGKSSNLVIDQ